MNRILIIDDDKELCALMKKCMEQEPPFASSADSFGGGAGIDAPCGGAAQTGIDTPDGLPPAAKASFVLTAYCGVEGLHLFTQCKEDCALVILDVMMPDLDGFFVLQKIREVSNVPILMLTAKSDESDKVSGLKLGADDYLTKPFGIQELIARVHSLIRRYTALNPAFPAESERLYAKDMVLDKANRTVTIRGLSVELTGKEFDLLCFLASNKGRVFTKKQLYNQVWDMDYAFDDNNLMSFISKLRKKIEPDPEHPFYILTVRGVGYRFNKEA